MKIVVHSLFLAMLIGCLYAESPLSTASLTRLNFDQRLGSQISLTTPFTNEYGQAIQLKDCLGSRPAILALGYYECPMLCNLVLNGIVHSLQEIESQNSDEPDVIFVSINPKESSNLALNKKLAYLKRYGHPRAADHWHFLTGTETNIRQLANDVGFAYQYDPINKQYAHPSGIIVLTPKGVVSKYFFGVTYATTDLSAALNNATAGMKGKPTLPLLMLCSKFMTLTGRHSQAVLFSVRALAVLSMIGVAGLILFPKDRAGKDLP
jgi:protein SCO1/2